MRYAIVIILAIGLIILFGVSINNTKNVNHNNFIDSSQIENQPGGKDLPIEKVSYDRFDSDAVKRLMPGFKRKVDEFENVVWIQPKTAPKYVSSNALYCYFQYVKPRAYNLRFRFQYAAEDWLFIQSCQFLIDGTNFNYVPRKMQTDNGYGGIWEWSDEAVDETTADILKALRNAKKAKVKYNGSHYYHITNITPQQIKSIKETMDLYEAMGGHL